MADLGLLVVVPARGGSKRVPRKNIALLGGRPLLAYTLELTHTAGVADCTVVSTEDVEIAHVAQDAGIAVLERPVALAGDTVSTEAVLLHVLKAGNRRTSTVDWVMTLPPTSPFRSAATLRRFIALAERAPPEIDCLMSVTETRGDFWQRSSTGRWQRLFPDAPRRQQDREPLYEENSAIYLTRRSALVETDSILGRHVEGVPIDPLEGFDINGSDDFVLAEAMIAAQLGQAPARNAS